MDNLGYTVFCPPQVTLHLAQVLCNHLPLRKRNLFCNRKSLTRNLGNKQKACEGIPALIILDCERDHFLSSKVSSSDVTNPSARVEIPIYSFVLSVSCCMHQQLVLTGTIETVTSTGLTREDREDRNLLLQETRHKSFTSCIPVTERPLQEPGIVSLTLFPTGEFATPC